MKNSILKLAKVVVATAAVTFLSANSSAILLTDPGVVGIHNGQLGNANPSTETPIAQHLLDMLANTTDGNYQTGPTEYAGAPTTILSFFQKIENVQEGDPQSVPAGHDYVLGKYDGPNGGYVLFALNDLAFDVPTKSGASNVGLWLNKGGNGVGLSHILIFDTQEFPDGGSTIALLGVGLVGLSMLRRKVS